jgi:hypothetical protein
MGYLDQYEDQYEDDKTILWVREICPE